MLCVNVFFLRGTISDDVGSLVGDEGELCCSFVFLWSRVASMKLFEAERGDLAAKLESELGDLRGFLHSSRFSVNDFLRMAWLFQCFAGLLSEVILESSTYLGLLL
jgi:hypothetical protein